MHRYLLLSVLLAPFVLASCAGKAPTGQAADTGERTGERTIAITFDDATLPDGPLYGGEERSLRLIAALDAAEVEEAMFFVTTGNVTKQGPGGVERIRAYAEAGHALANHSHSHWWLHETDVDDYVADLDRAIDILDAYVNVQPYFRFPFLDEGRDLARRDALRAALAERGLRNGYVTVDTWDWYLVDLTREAQEAGVAINFDELGELYVDVILKSTEYYDAMAERTLGRSPHHVLLLHENDLAAMYIDELAAALRENGFEIIPATEAFTDPIAERDPETLYLGQGRIAALAHEGGADPETLPSPTENKDYLRRRFDAEVAPLPEG